MGTSLTPATLADVRAAIAWAVRGRDESPLTVGSITLVSAQRECVQRAKAAISSFGGALIASDVGSGKTFVALAIASEYARPLVIGPAALRTMWTSATLRARTSIPFISFESLGRGRAPPVGHDVVIVDEAHHVRNRLTQTHQAVRRTINGARAVLLSATPIHNRATDLDALLGLFLADDARDLDEEARARVVVRTAETAAGPNIVVHPKVALPDSAELIAKIKVLPPPVAVRDGGVAATLMRLSLLRAWCSSAGALDAMLRRATLRASALADALRAGRHPTRAELKSFSDDGQLAFAELIATGRTTAGESLRAIDEHLRAIISLRKLTNRSFAVDNERARRLAAFIIVYPGVPILACTQYAATVEAYWNRLRMKPGVCALTSRGARIASGTISRDDALARFAPVAQGARAPHERERIHLLIATDLVSEGVNLHDAGVIVHLDLPWTAARVAQRVGRIARMGSPHECVHAYELAPPHAAAEALALTQRLMRKRSIAARLIGGDRRFSQLMGDAATSSESAAESRARMVKALAPFATSHPAARAITCTIAAQAFAWVAVVGDREGGEAPRIVVGRNRAPPTANPRVVANAAELIAQGIECPSDSSLTGQAESQLNAWLEQQRAKRLAGIDRRHAARARGPALAAAVGSVSASPAHERARAAANAAAFIPGSRPPVPDSLLALVVFSPDAIRTSRPAL